ncbi:MAG: hypothetical protein AB8B51_16160 [Sedimentitalea sp.]
MDLVADILLVAGALGAGFYCFVLSKRLNKFNNLEQGVGGAVAVLSSQVDDLTKTLQAAQGAADGSNKSLAELTERAEGVAVRLELLMASLHDVPSPTEDSLEPDETTHADIVGAPSAKATPLFVRRARVLSETTQ